MKYTTFILLRNCVGAGLIGLAGLGIVKGCTSATRPAPIATHSQSGDFSPGVASPGVRTPAKPTRSGSASSRPQHLAATATDAPARQPLSSLDRKVIELSKGALTNGSADSSGRKWRVKQDRITIELRSDSAKGSTNWNRLKIDLDRDKNWDEAWDLKPGKPIKRRIAPADDENYTVTYDLQGETWVKRDK